MKKWIGIIITIVLMAGAGYWAYEKYKPQPEAPMEVPPPITFDVTQETMTQTILVKGKSVYTEQADVFAPYASSIKQWHVKNGDQVKKGIFCSRWIRLHCRPNWIRCRVIWTKQSWM